MGVAGAELSFLRDDPFAVGLFVDPFPEMYDEKMAGEKPPRTSTGGKRPALR